MCIVRNQNTIAIRTTSMPCSSYDWDVVLYFLLSLLKTRVPTNIAADSANPKYEKFRS